MNFLTGLGKGIKEVGDSYLAFNMDQEKKAAQEGEKQWQIYLESLKHQYGLEERKFVADEARKTAEFSAGRSDTRSKEAQDRADSRYEKAQDRADSRSDKAQTRADDRYDKQLSTQKEIAGIRAGDNGQKDQVAAVAKALEYVDTAKLDVGKDGRINPVTLSHINFVLSRAGLPPLQENTTPGEAKTFLGIKTGGHEPDKISYGYASQEQDLLGERPDMNKGKGAKSPGIPGINPNDFAIELEKIKAQKQQASSPTSTQDARGGIAGPVGPQLNSSRFQSEAPGTGETLFDKNKESLLPIGSKVKDAVSTKHTRSKIRDLQFRIDQLQRQKQNKERKWYPYDETELKEKIAELQKLMGK